MKHITYLSIIFITMISCRTPMVPIDPCPPNCEEDSIIYSLEMVWESYLYEDTTAMLFSGLPVEYKNNVLFAGWEPQHTDFFYVLMFDKDSGELIHKFEHYKNSISILSIVDKYLITTCFDGLRVFDLEKLELVKHIEGIFEGNNNSFGNDVFVIQDFNSLPFLDSSSVFKLNIPTLKMKKIITITKEEHGGYASLNPVSIDIIGGDTIIYGTFDGFDSNLYAYNVTQDKYIWHEIYSNLGGDKYFNAPIFDDENIYITYGHQAAAFDKFTGKPIWITPMEGFYRAQKPQLINGRLYFKAWNDHLYCLNTSDGKVIWHNNKAGNSTNIHPAYFDNKLIWSDEASMYVVDLENGEVVFREDDGPYETLDLDNLEESKKLFAEIATCSPFVDEEKGVFYIPDFKRMFCFKIPDEW